MILILCILAYLVAFAAKLYLGLRNKMFNYTDIEPLSCRYVWVTLASINYCYNC